MEATSEPSKALPYKTWVLQVYIHCEGCKRKVKKVLQSIDGVYTTNVDSAQQKVTVVGDIDADILIAKLQKVGKHAHLCPTEEKPVKKAGGKGGEAGGKAGKKAGKKSSPVDETKDEPVKDEKSGDAGETKQAATDENKAAGDAEAPPPSQGNKAAGEGGKEKGKKKGNANANANGNGNANASANANGNANPNGGGGENSGDVSAAAAPAAAEGPVLAPSIFSQMMQQQQYPPPFIPPVSMGYGHWTPAVNYNAATPAVSYTGSSYPRPPPPYFQAYYTMPYNSGGMVQYMPPGAYPRRPEDCYAFNDENANSCSVM